MSTTMSDSTTEQTTATHGQNGSLREQAKFPRPAWATSTQYPEDGSHEGHVTVGPVTLSIGQDIPVSDEPGPIYCWLPEECDRVFGAQACRDLAAALMEAARVIEAASS